MAVFAANITVIGRLVADPEVKQGTKGAFVTARVAVNHAKDRVSFFDIMTSGNQGDRLTEGVKGSLVHINGTLELQNYQTKDESWRTRAQIYANRVDVFYDERTKAAAAATEGTEKPF